MKQLRAWYFFILLAFLLANFGCESEKNETCTSTGPINSAACAKIVVQSITNEVIYGTIIDLVPEQFNLNLVINGNSGTAAVTGAYSIKNIDCGNNCSGFQNNYDLSIQFDNYQIMTSTNKTITVTGTVALTDQLWEVFPGGRPGGELISRSANISYQSLEQDGRSGFQDTLSFEATGASPDNLSGTGIPSNGITYAF